MVTSFAATFDFLAVCLIAAVCAVALAIVATTDTSRLFVRLIVATVLVAVAVAGFLR
jgi:hypothetical protein